MFWWSDRSRKRILAFSAFFCSGGIAAFLNILLTGPLGPASIVPIHVITVAGLWALLWAIAEQSSQRLPNMGIIASGVIACIIAFIALRFGQVDMARFTQHIHAAILFGLGALLMWQGGARRLSEKALLVSMTAYSFTGFVLPFVHAIIWQHFGESSEAAWIAISSHILILSTLTFALAASLIGIIIQQNIRAERDRMTIDELSGLRLRHRFQNDAATLIDLASDAGVDLSLIMIDIDHFKLLNDTYGHAGGDQAITRFGALIRDSIRDRDISGRVGGEEFCVLVWNCPLVHATNLAERMRRSLSDPHLSSPAFTASFGVAEWQSDESYASLIKRADAALYEAKNSGRNRVVTEKGEVRSDDAENEALRKALSPPARLSA